MISPHLGVVVPEHLQTKTHTTLLQITLLCISLFYIILGYHIDFLNIMGEDDYISHIFHIKIIKELRYLH